MSQQTETEAITNTGTRTGAIMALAAGCLLFLAAHYLLGEWAEGSLMAHDLQHILIFIAGTTTGISSYKLLKR